MQDWINHEWNWKVVRSGSMSALNGAVVFAFSLTETPCIVRTAWRTLGAAHTARDVTGH